MWKGILIGVAIPIVLYIGAVGYVVVKLALNDDSDKYKSSFETCCKGGCTGLDNK